jgi:hypothetical protein
MVCQPLPPGYSLIFADSRDGERKKSDGAGNGGFLTRVEAGSGKDLEAADEN